MSSSSSSSSSSARYEPLISRDGLSSRHKFRLKIPALKPFASGPTVLHPLEELGSSAPVPEDFSRLLSWKVSVRTYRILAWLSTADPERWLSLRNLHLFVAYAALLSLFTWSVVNLFPRALADQEYLWFPAQACFIAAILVHFWLSLLVMRNFNFAWFFRDTYIWYPGLKERTPSNRLLSIVVLVLTIVILGGVATFDAYLVASLIIDFDLVFFIDISYVAFTYLDAMLIVFNMNTFMEAQILRDLVVLSFEPLTQEFSGEAELATAINTFMTNHTRARAVLKQYSKRKSLAFLLSSILGVFSVTSSLLYTIIFIQKGYMTFVIYNLFGELFGTMVALLPIYSLALVRQKYDDLWDEFSSSHTVLLDELALYHDLEHYVQAHPLEVSFLGLHLRFSTILPPLISVLLSTVISLVRAIEV